MNQIERPFLSSFHLICINKAPQLRGQGSGLLIRGSQVRILPGPQIHTANIIKDIFTANKNNIKYLVIRLVTYSNFFETIRNFENVIYCHQNLASFVQRLGHRPFTAGTRVQIPYGVLIWNGVQIISKLPTQIIMNYHKALKWRLWVRIPPWPRVLSSLIG